MPAREPGRERAPRLADRLAAARRSRFVGRVSEIELFRAALLEAEPPFAVLHVYGPGGVGKTTLLSEYARVGEETGVRTVPLDGRNLEPSPQGFLRGLQQAMGLPDGISPVDVLGRRDCCVLLIDTYEVLTPLDAWLREEFLPQLPGRSLVVIAGRNPPASAWRADPGWRDLVRIVSLRNLRPEESRTYLLARGVPESSHAAALEFTHGHPLALALVADVLTQGEAAAMLSLEQQPDVIRLLLERFVAQAPTRPHREALEVCAHVRVTTEALLAEVLGADDAHEIFAWLRGLSFMEQGPEGLFPHDLAREVLDTDLRWRNPEGYRALHRRVRRYLVRRYEAARGIERQRAFFDLVYLHRHHPLMKPYYDWKAMGSAYAAPATAGDLPAILAMVQRHEGEASAQIARHWWGRQPQAFTVFRTGDDTLMGFLATIAIHDLGGDDLEADPAVRAAWDYARRYGPVRPGEEVIYHRLWMERDGHQSLAVHNLVATVATGHWVSNPRLAWAFVAAADADFWQPMFTYLDFRRSPEADFQVGGRRYGVFTHDWRAEPPAVWLQTLAERELATDLTVEALGTQRPAPLLVLSQPEFQEAVRRALRDYTRPAALAANPLLRSRVVADQAGRDASPAALQALLREAAESLCANPRDERLYRAVWRTYLEPAPTQEAAAEALGLPFGTYRRYLVAGVDRITAWLWHRELYGPQT